ncbi:MAG: hypothetical protein M3153_12500 [Chloroflexota bacterium]|nr:hypothetical protein [Chloroflexota bacterium]
MERIAHIVLVKDDLVPAEAARPHESHKRAQTFVIDMRKERATTKAIDSQSVIRHAASLSSSSPVGRPRNCPLGGAFRQDRVGHATARARRGGPGVHRDIDRPVVTQRIASHPRGTEDSSIERRTAGRPEEAQEVFAPNISTHQLADQIHHERLSHAALIQKVTRERSTDSVSIDRMAQRRATSRRLAATLTAAALTFVIAAAASATQQTEAAASQHSAGGGVTLLR